MSPYHSLSTDSKNWVTAQSQNEKCSAKHLNKALSDKSFI